MTSTRRTKPRTAKQDKPAGGARRPAAKTAKPPPDEELGPERRIALAQQAEARRLRGKPPSI